MSSLLWTLIIATDAWSERHGLKTMTSFLCVSQDKEHWNKWKYSIFITSFILRFLLCSFDFIQHKTLLCSTNNFANFGLKHFKININPKIDIPCPLQATFTAKMNCPLKVPFRAGFLELLLHHPSKIFSFPSPEQHLFKRWLENFTEE